MGATCWGKEGGGGGADQRSASIETRDLAAKEFLQELVVPRMQQAEVLSVRAGRKLCHACYTQSRAAGLQVSRRGPPGRDTSRGSDCGMHTVTCSYVKIETLSVFCAHFAGPLVKATILKQPHATLVRVFSGNSDP